VSPSNPRLLKSSALQFTALLNAAPAGGPMQWSSSNPAVTTIDGQGKATLFYIHTVEHFAHYFRCSPDQLGPEHTRQCQVALFRKFKLAPNPVSQRLAALRFFYMQPLKKGWSVAETLIPKKALNLPIILGQEEVARLINAPLTPFHRIILTLYATPVLT
jgi:hypothetical protein